MARKGRKTIWRQQSPRSATLHLGRTARNLEPETRTIVDDQGAVYHYDKLLLATGGVPRRLPSADPDAGVIYFRTIEDYRRLRRLTEEKQRFAVIGGGFIGSEIAAALALQHKDVVLVFPGDGIGSRMFPDELSRFLNEFCREKGVDVRAGTQAATIDRRGSHLVVKTQDLATTTEQELTVDVVVAGLGIQPNVDLARDAGLNVGDGVRVDLALRTSSPHIYAAGDVAEFFNPALGTYLRVEHEDNANTMGEMAGRSMAGGPVSYDHLPFFYSDLFELGYEAVGEVDSRLETLSDWKEPFREGAVYYLRGGRVRGALLWNVWERVEAARQLIAEAAPFRPEDLRGRLIE